ncbi:hypothetical protein AVDCRST_MAG94-273 [uncultured Leptolyngbya sp.]|uniref:Uncharacterized protein n=1 Tax=uncultured Leptolyngbya sp. TaxID=332963 RepID=A0A6J4K9L6_9CYAN|nr:hypothetical protein AVDCRST_MAG94-273 [uncultured Leptolyngbya sp.]
MSSRILLQINSLKASGNFNMKKANLASSCFVRMHGSKL